MKGHRIMSINLDELGKKGLESELEMLFNKQQDKPGLLHHCLPGEDISIYQVTQ